MMPTEHDEALVERVALAIHNAAAGIGKNLNAGLSTDVWRAKARAVIYPPAPPKTRLQVARELLAQGYEAQIVRENRISYGPERAREGCYDNNAEMHAIMTALALPAMED